MRRIVVGTVLLLLVGLGTAAVWLLYSESGLQWALAQARARLPGTLTYATVSGRLSGPIHAADITYRSDTLELRLGDAELDWRPWALLYGRLHFTALHISDVAIDSRPQSAQEQKPARWQLPIAVRIDSGQLQRLRLSRDAKEIFTVDDARLALRARGGNVAVADLRVDGPTLSLTADGELDSDAGIRIQWQFETPGSARWAGSGTLRGDLPRLRLQQEISEPANATVDAEIDLAAGPQFQAQLALNQTQVNRIRADWPAVAVSGRIDARGTVEDFESKARLLAEYQSQRLNIDAALARRGGRLLLHRAELSIPHLPGRLFAEGHVDLAAPTPLSLRLNWRDLRWPGTGAIESPEGKAELTGTIGDYRLQSESSFRLPNLPPLHARLAARGDATALTLNRLTLAALNGTLTATGKLQRDPWRWQLTLRGDGLDPGAQWPAWPGEIAFNARVHGSYRAKRLRNELAVTTLSGTINDRPVIATGTWRLDGTRHEIADLSARIGTAHLQARGSIARTWDIVTQASVPHLGALWPTASGSARASLRLSGPRPTPVLDGEIDLTRARYGGYALDELGAKFRLDGSNRTRSTLAADARRLRHGARTIDSARLTADGMLDAHTLLLHLQTADTDLSAELRGGYASRAWAGRINAVAIAATYGKWSLQTPAPLHIGSARMTAGPLCLRTAAGGRVCGSADLPAAGAGEATLRAHALPLAWLNPLLPGALRLRGDLDATFDARFDDRQPVSAHADLKLSPGALYAPHEERAAIGFDGGSGRVLLDDSGLRANVDIALAADDTIGAELSLPRFRPQAAAGQDQPLAGRVRARLHDLSRFGALLIDLDTPRGRIDVDVTLGGTLALPTLRGAATLADASANVPALGIRVRKVNLRASGDGTRTLRLDGSAASGAGELVIDGTLALREGNAWDARLRASGQRLEVANIPQAWVLASPDLQLTARPGRVQLQGSVDIPEAKLNPKPLARPVSSSPDVVIVNAPEVAEDAGRGWAVETQVRITLGEKVEFDGFGLTGIITGGLVATDSPEQLTTARGELRINDGQYEAYGRKLEIERGRLLFAGGPIDNPGVDARAVRRVEDVTAGIAIGGTLKSPELRLFSEPALSESDTLSYLLFGRPLQSTSGAQGRALASAATALKLSGGERIAENLAGRFGIEEVGIESGSTSDEASLVLGKHLSPRLYVNYSIGLFEQINVLRLRYRLSAHWALQVESGTYAGADLLYTIER